MLIEFLFSVALLVYEDGFALFVFQYSAEQIGFSQIISIVAAYSAVY
jgi:hypothetical protein